MTAPPALPLAGAMLALAAAASCPAPARPQVDITFSQKPPVVRNDVASAALPRPPNSYSNVTDHDFPYVGGLILNKIVADDARLSFGGVTWPGTGEQCAWPAVFTLALRYEPEIYIASNYRPGTCHYNETLSHEYRHMQIQTQTVQLYLPALRRAVREGMARAGAQGPFPPGETEAYKARITEIVMESFSKAAQEMAGMIALRQKAMDTAVEYERSARACAHEKVEMR